MACATIRHAPLVAWSRWPRTLAAAPIAAADPLAEARRLYNAGQYDAAEQAALAALKHARRPPKRRALVLGRIHLERFRQSADPAELPGAAKRCERSTRDASIKRDRARADHRPGRVALPRRSLRPGRGAFRSRCSIARLRSDRSHTSGCSTGGPPPSIALRSSAREARAETYTPHRRRRMEQELALDPGSAAAAYWLTAAARGMGDLGAGLGCSRRGLGRRPPRARSRRLAARRSRSPHRPRPSSPSAPRACRFAIPIRPPPACSPSGKRSRPTGAR